MLLAGITGLVLVMFWLLLVDGIHLVGKRAGAGTVKPPGHVDLVAVLHEPPGQLADYARLSRRERRAVRDDQ